MQSYLKEYRTRNSIISGYAPALPHRHQGRHSVGFRVRLQGGRRGGGYIGRVSAQQQDKILHSWQCNYMHASYAITGIHTGIANQDKGLILAAC
jgi:hypothetical protein